MVYCIWHKKLFLSLMDIALLIANILNDKHGSKTPFLQFKMKVDRKKFGKLWKFQDRKAVHNWTNIHFKGGISLQ